MAHVVRLNAGQPTAVLTAPLSLTAPAGLRVRNIGATTIWVGDGTITPESAKVYGYPLYPGDEQAFPIGDLTATTIIDPSAISGKGLYSTPPRGDWGAVIAWDVIPA